MAKFAEYDGTKPSILIKKALDVIHEPGTVFEIRIPKTRAGTMSAYFTDTTIAAALAAKENGKHQAIYTTVNPVNPPLVARSENQFAIGNPTTTTDAEIEKRRWFLLDFDPVRPAGISSSDNELEAAKDRAISVRDWLTTLDWPLPVEGMSGNGYHLMYRVDEPNNDDTRVLFEFATKMLAAIWTDDKVSVDTTVFNAARVWKIYGTISAKGSSTEDRPHRVAMLQAIPSPIDIVPIGLIENVARPLKEAKSEEFKDMTGEYITDMSKWLSDRGQTVTAGPKPMFGNEGQKWLISRCPFNETHQSPMVGLVNNRPVFRCLHNSCSAFRWKEFREKIDPSYKDPDTVYRRLKEWCEGDTEHPEQELLQTACQLGKRLDSVIKQLKKECGRHRVRDLEDHIRLEKRRFQNATNGENNEKGNIVGLVNRTRLLQAEGIVPMYWTADYDGRARAGKVGDIDCPRVLESDEIQLMMKFHRMGDSWVRQVHAKQVITVLAEEYRINPLRIHMKQFEWDGTKRLDDWLPRYLGTKNTEYTRAVGRKWLISAVARAMEPGCQADHMLILEGKQGIGKSQALRIIGGQFYTEFTGSMKAASGHKDMIATIIGKLIVEMSELATIKRADMESLKAILTRTVDDERLSYERDVKAYPRTCVFSGTTNEIGQSYIADSTGARRFWPVTCGKINIELLKQDRDQLWAEAVDAYEKEEDWWTVPEDLTLEEQSERQMTIEQIEPWHDKIKQAILSPESYENEVFYARDEYINGSPTGEIVIRAGTTHAILGIVLGVETSRQSQSDALRVMKILKEIGFQKIRPNSKWMGATYCRDLKKDAMPHLWPAVIAAVERAKIREEFKPET